MNHPNEQEVRDALKLHAERVGDRWTFFTHPDFSHTEAEALRLTKVNLMLGTVPNSSVTSQMLEAIVDRIAALERRTAQIGPAE